MVAAMWTEVPGLVSLDNQISAADDSLTALRDLLASAGIAERISGALDSSDGTKLIVSGSPDEAERQKWLEVRASLAERFGASLQIVERFSATVNLVPARIDAEPRSDVVAVVMGPMPYVLLRDGTRQAASARKGDR
ncbi:MAG: EscD/YscD/HrpQ family type III secretion system periplasmic domain-containing protein [Gammaproteobacteria bacterium]